MKVAFLVLDVYGAGGTARSVITQANALAALGQEVTILSMVRAAGTTHAEVDPAVHLHPLVDRTDPGHPRTVRRVVDDDLAARLDTLPSVLVPDHWDTEMSALVDAACEEVLPTLDADVLVSVTPGALAVAVQLAPASTALVHQEHGASFQRLLAMEPLRTFAPRVDVVAMPTSSVREWFVEAVTPLAPRTVVVPNPLLAGFRPRSTLQTRLVVAAGRLDGEKQFTRLVRAFGEIADQVRDWRLRIVGEGPYRLSLIRLTRKLGLYDRVELPGLSDDMPSEWAAASVAALTSRTEGLPLVVQEAMAAGVPVAAFEAPSGPRGLIEHEVNGLLVAPGSTEGLSSALLRLTGDDELRTRLGQGALDSSRAFAPDVIARRWVEVFEETVAGRRGGSRPLLQRVTELAKTPPPPVVPEAATDTTPAQARALAVQWAARCARRVDARWFVIPPHGTDPAVVVISMTDRDAFLTELGGDEAPHLLSLVKRAKEDWQERRGSLPDLARATTSDRTARLSLEPWPLRHGIPGLLSVGCRVDLEFWESAPDGTLVAPEPNAYTMQVDPRATTIEIDIEGVRVPTLPLMAEPTVLDCRFPVDAVYTWVDGSDPAWNDAREARLSALPASAHRKESSGRARFVSRDELRYSLRSLHLFAPWVRTIHLVSAGQVPAWLTDHPKVHVVDHAEILPPDALPTFNSHAIESCLHKVPGLAEHFVYLNDDFLLGRPLPPQIFFTPAGQPSVFFSGHNLGLGDEPGAAPWLRAAWNNRELLRATFGVVSTHSLAHAPYAHRRSVLEEIEERFPEELARTARSPFRAAGDISLLSSFAQHYGLMTGAAVVGTPNLSFVNISANDVARRLRLVQLREQDFICFGDHHEHALKPEFLHELLDTFFESYLPVPAPWETGGAR